MILCKVSLLKHVTGIFSQDIDLGNPLLQSLYVLRKQKLFILCSNDLLSDMNCFMFDDFCCRMEKNTLLKLLKAERAFIVYSVSWTS